jgi:carbon storage regulator CsrA
VRYHSGTEPTGEQMTVVKRKLNDTILIGEVIRVRVMEIQGREVSLGIEALPDLFILREETSPDRKTHLLPDGGNKFEGSDLARSEKVNIQHIEGQDKNLLQVSAAANRLGISKGTLYRWVYMRRIPYIKLGRRLLFSPEDLDKLIKASRIDPMEMGRRGRRI